MQHCYLATVFNGIFYHFNGNYRWILRNRTRNHFQFHWLFFANKWLLVVFICRFNRFSGIKFDGIWCTKNNSSSYLPVSSCFTLQNIYLEIDSMKRSNNQHGSGSAMPSALKWIKESRCCSCYLEIRGRIVWVWIKCWQKHPKSCDDIWLFVVQVLLSKLRTMAIRRPL